MASYDKLTDKIDTLRNLLNRRYNQLIDTQDKLNSVIFHLPQFSNVIVQKIDKSDTIDVDMKITTESDFELLNIYPNIRVKELTLAMLLVVEESKDDWEKLGYRISKTTNGQYEWKHCDRHSHLFEDNKLTLTYFDPEYNMSIFNMALQKYPQQLSRVNHVVIKDEQRHVRKNNDDPRVESVFEDDYSKVKLIPQITCQDHISLVCKLKSECSKDSYKGDYGCIYRIEGRHPAVFDERTKFISLTSTFIEAVNRIEKVSWIE
jgi:hypothetical protein